MVATMQASKVFEALQPFEHLQEALSHRGHFAENLAAVIAPEDKHSTHQHEGVLLSPDVASYQCLGEGPARNTAKKDVRKIRAKPVCI